ncbi:MAG: zinc ribbon domain-containing protein [Firmicutes bacterium]|nr:zinc ribbon domain-containing protein [Bacillota bacterium]
MDGQEFCPECGEATKANQKVCLNCGTLLGEKPLVTPPAKSGTMKHCRECGQEVKEHAEICVNCGVYPLNSRNYCQECGAKTTEKQEVCTNCGVRLIHRARATVMPSIPQGKDKNPTTAAIISCFIPGAGQIYLGQLHKGLAIIAAAIMSGILTGGTLSFLVWIVAIVDAYRIGTKVAQGQAVDTWEFF